MILERYIFRRTLSALVLTFLALSATIWLTQALRRFDLVTSLGQSLFTFLHLTSLIFPSLVLVIAPTALLIAVLYCLNLLNSDSELVVINASGASPGVLLRPILAIAVLVTGFVAAAALHYAPEAERRFQTLLTDISANFISSVLRPGEFRNITAGLTMFLRERHSNGTLEGIFVIDRREPAQTVAYIAARGAVVENPLGTFLIMQDGTIQRRTRDSGAISIIEFQSYAFDLSTFASTGSEPRLKPSARPTAYLLNPDVNDPYFQQYPDRFRAELHNRLVMPLHILMTALIPLAFFAQARTTRQGRGTAIGIAVALVVAARSVGFLLGGGAASDPQLVPLVYAWPAGVSAIALFIVIRGRRIAIPEWMTLPLDLIQRRLAARAARSAPKPDYL